jgi:hypothetical protein
MCDKNTSYPGHSSRDLVMEFKVDQPMEEWLHM